jgi:cyclohexadieny/prephenate dehydrogenase
MAARRFGVAGRVRVWARRAESREACAESDWCCGAFADPGEAVAGSGLVVICTPVDRIVETVRSCSRSLMPGALVTDVGSTKSRICRHASHEVPSETVFIGSHPMAGSEKSGMHHARADLFQGRACMVTPLEQAPPEAVDCLVRFWRQIGMDVSSLSPEKHDEIVARISHLPHLLASVLALQLSRSPDPWKALAGNGLRDTTRIAAGSPDIWRSIFEENREELLRALSDFEDQLAEVRSHLHNGEWLRLRQMLEKGKQYRDDLD